MDWSRQGRGWRGVRAAGPAAFLAALALAATGCGRSDRAAPAPVDALALIGRLGDPLEIARLDRPGARLVASTDPTGGNDDFGHFLRDGPPGWKVLADETGPGFVSRFWFTGARDGAHRIRFYFDGEAEPRIDTTLAEFCGGAEPNTAPFAAHENYCWYNLVPLPFRERLVVMCETGPDPAAKLYYQLNVHSLPRGTPVESFRGTWNDAERAALAEARRRWSGGSAEPDLAGAGWRELAAGAETEAGRWDGGPAILAEIALELDPRSMPDADARADVLRDLRLRFYWDDAAESDSDAADGRSVDVPLGDFFGNGWHRAQHASAAWRVEGWTFAARWSMPFRRAARWTVFNAGPRAVRARFAAVAAPNTEPERYGYFHAEFRRSGPATGAPHTVLDARGRGHYAGCVLSVSADDESYWILEGDESIRVDGERRPGWRGTGLEDYFNGGWYYQNVLARPLHGLTFKAPFRTIQYRIHRLDRVAFRSAVEVEFERGPGHGTRGWMESVAFYYLERPAAAYRGDLAAGARTPPAPLGTYTIMTELWNLERWGDIAEAEDHLARFLARRPGDPRAEMLRLRAAAYRARRGGFETARAEFEASSSSADPAVRAAAEHLRWFHADTRHALLFLYANAPARAFIDGRPVLSADDPARVAVARIVTDGENLPFLSVEAGRRDYPDWVQALLRTHRGDAITHPGWRMAFDPPGDPHDPALDDSAWPRLGGTGVKGPPEEPFVEVVVDPYVDVQSRAVGLRPTRPWPPGAVRAVYRSDRALAPSR